MSDSAGADSGGRQGTPPNTPPKDHKTSPVDDRSSHSSRSQKSRRKDGDGGGGETAAGKSGDGGGSGFRYTGYNNC